MVGDNIFYVDNWCVHTALSCRWRFPPSGWPEPAESIHAPKIMFKEYLAKRFQNLQQLAAWVTWWRSHAGALPQKPPLSLPLGFSKHFLFNFNMDENIYLVLRVGAPLAWLFNISFSLSRSLLLFRHSLTVNMDENVLPLDRPSCGCTRSIPENHDFLCHCLSRCLSPYLSGFPGQFWLYFHRRWRPSSSQLLVKGNWGRIGESWVSWKNKKTLYHLLLPHPCSSNFSFFNLSLPNSCSIFWSWWKGKLSWVWLDDIKCFLPPLLLNTFSPNPHPLICHLTLSFTTSFLQ